jgi:hypothetical protein
MAGAVVDTVRLTTANRHRFKGLRESWEKFDQGAAAENCARWNARQALCDEGLVPVRHALGRLRHLDLAELTEIEMPNDDLGQMGAELRRMRASVLPTVAGVVVSGALVVVSGHLASEGAGAGAKYVVRAFGSSSNGKPLRLLHGAAADSALMAWFGGGSKASGGGGIAAGLRTLSNLKATAGSVAQRSVAVSRSAEFRRQQQRRARRLAGWEGQMREAQDAAPALHELSADMRRVLQHLHAALASRLPAFVALVEACDDFGQYDCDQRAQVAAMAAIAELAVRVLNCPITAADGRMNELTGVVVADVEAQLLAMETNP